MSDFVLHVGTHKTGTTAIQKFLNTKRDELADLGVFYDPGGDIFGVNGYGHHHLAHALARNSDTDKANVAAYHERLFEAQSNGMKIVISSEPFCRYMLLNLHENNGDPAPFQARFYDYFKPFKPRVSIYFRRPDSFAVSSYKENISSTNVDLKFPDFLELRRTQFEYASRLAGLEDLFGEARVFCYEDAMAQGTLSHFLRKHGLPDLKPENTARVRSGISNLATLWLGRAKRELELSKQETRRRWYFAMTERAKVHFPETQKTSFWNSTQERDNFLAQSLQGFRFAAFWSDPKPEPAQSLWTDEQHRATEAAYDIWQKQNRLWLAAREQKGLAPYDPDTGFSALERASIHAKSRLFYLLGKTD